MVTVDVGEQNGCPDVLRPVAGGTQIVDQLARRRSEQLAGAGVDQDPVRAGVDHESN